jgi:ABC-type transport system involved in multi-copper enzyme maturation permease subunit
MSTVTAGAIAARPVAGGSHPSFFGLMRGEWLKITRQWTFWIMIALMFGGYTLFNWVLSQGPGLKDNITHFPLLALGVMTQAPLFLLRVFWGMMLIILTARLIGMEYSGGTVRVILARGVGRLQLLAAQLSVMAVIAVVGGVVFVGYSAILELIGVQAVAGNLDVFKAADATFWADTQKYALSVLISLGVSILLAAAVTAVTRSLAAGLTVSVIWFPIDNFAIIILVLGDRLTHWDFWSLVSGDFLGLNLNAMGSLVMSSHTPALINNFLTPLVPVTGAHTLLVTAIYAVAFLAVAIGVTFAKDVQE